jgi:parvulin-like peptidyl-prolyl isomerase
VSAGTRARLLLCGALVAGLPARAEIVEEIVAWVNGDVITRSELQEEERAAIQDAYRNQTGEALDREVAGIRRDLLLHMIDRKILLDRAPRFADMQKLADYFYEQFRAQQDVESDEEFERMLARDGLTPQAVREKLLEMFAPEEVKRMEVGGRVAIADATVEEYYASHAQEFREPGSVTLREIVLLVDGAAAREPRRAEAERLRERALSEDFARLAEEFSEAGTRSGGGLLGPLRRGDLSAQLEEVAFSLPLGTVSPVLDLPYGYHILKIEQRVEDRQRSLDEVREELRDRLADEKYSRELAAFMDKARAEAEWCVKAKFRDMLSIPSPECRSF